MSYGQTFRCNTSEKLLTNIAAEIVVMAQQSTVVKTQKLFKRTVSATMLLVIAGLAIWRGGVVLNCFLFLLSSLLIWEWFCLVSVLAKIVRLLFSTLLSLGVVLAGSMIAIELQVALIGAILLAGQSVALWKHGRFGFHFRIGVPYAKL